jgi:hypothetical protein
LDGMTFEPPPPPAKPRNNVRTILIVVGIVLALCCGGVIVGGYLLFRGVAEATGPVHDAAVAYVEDIIDHDYAGAYDHLCGKVKSQISESDFATATAQSFDVRAYSVVGTNVMNRNGKVSATVTMKLTMANGTPRTQIFPMVKEAGDWKVCE